MMYRLGIYEKAMPESLSLTEKLEAAKRLGFDFAEMSVDESDLKLARLDMPARERERLLSAMCRGGIHYESMCLSAHRKYPLGSRDAAARAKSLEIGEKAVVLARDLGIRMIQLAGYDVYYQESGADTAAYFEESLKALTGYASQYGVVLAFETMETPFMNTVKKAMAYVSKLSSPYLQVYPDIGNITNSGADVAADIAEGRGHIAAVHLKETRPNVFRELRFGDGHVDFAGAVAACKEAGVYRYLAEMWCVNADGWESELAAANSFLRSILDREYRA